MWMASRGVVSGQTARDKALQRCLYGHLGSVEQRERIEELHRRSSEGAKAMNKVVMWRKSSYSNGQANCVEVAFVESAVALRDSKNPNPVMTFTPGNWDAFVTVLRATE
jgi:hypothetical protein